MTPAEYASELAKLGPRTALAVVELARASGKPHVSAVAAELARLGIDVPKEWRK